MKTNTTIRLAMLLALGCSTPMAMAEEVTTTTTIEKTTTPKPVAPAPGTIATSVRDGANFSILYKAIQAAGLEESLGGKGPFTVFAPTDEAFGKLPAGSLEKLLLPENKEKLRALLTYHVVAGLQPSPSLIDGELKTTSGDSVKIDVDGSNEPIEVNDSKIVNADQITNNGVIHVIDKVLVPKSLDGFAGLED